jgi:hypothetical protein
VQDLILVIVILWMVIGGAVGGICGESQGRAGLGIVLGILAGPLGWIAAAALEPSAKVRNRRDEQLADAIAARLMEVPFPSDGRRQRKFAAQPQHLLAPGPYLSLEPGFYIDPLDATRERYWSGEEWDTETYPLEKGIGPARPDELS